MKEYVVLGVILAVAAAGAGDVTAPRLPTHGPEHRTASGSGVAPAGDSMLELYWDLSI